MDATRLLSAPVDQASTEVQSQSTSLVPVTRLPLSTDRSSSQSDSAYPSDKFVWTVSVADDGSFNFYAVPRAAYSGSGQGGNSSSSQYSDQSWAAASGAGLLDPSYAATQYAFYATSGMQEIGQLINIYA
jgi:hypothetical protein